ncbi:MAG: CDP-alcohol phosphatidyltransferase family protein [Candidatus Dormibacteraeota bacterium]|nr:CDP-alcohol phosphatidyltransferase family protein [Candidatus Dormibacteraeota bacterium]
MLALYGSALTRLRAAPRLRHSLVLWSAIALVAGEGFTVGVVVVHSTGAMLAATVSSFVWWVLVLVVVVGGAAWLDTPDGTRLDRYGVPNGLTALRAWACIPLLFVALLSLPGRLALMLWAGVGGAVGLLDALDGAIARRYGPISKLGKAIDPFGDALFFVVGSIGCYLLGIVPLWLAVLVIFRYAAPVVLTPVVFLAHRRPELVHTVWGRRNTILTGIVFFTLFWVRVADGPVDVAALFAALPTLVPTMVLHFDSLARRTLTAPRV